MSKKMRYCQCGCGQKYRPAKSWQKYATITCKNRAASQRMRELAKRARSIGEREKEREAAV